MLPEHCRIDQKGLETRPEIVFPGLPKESFLGWEQWLTPVIPARQEAEIGRIMV
jgi:hypothetical protein